MKTNPNGTAYPFVLPGEGCDQGLTKREWAYFTILGGLCARDSTFPLGSTQKERIEVLIDYAREITDAAFADLNTDRTIPEPSDPPNPSESDPGTKQGHSSVHDVTCKEN